MAMTSKFKSTVPNFQWVRSNRRDHVLSHDQLVLVVVHEVQDEADELHATSIEFEMRLQGLLYGLMLHVAPFLLAELVALLADRVPHGKT
jgi:hypothetical protein